MLTGNGMTSQVTPWYIAVAILGVMMVGFRSGLFWGAVTVLTMVAIFVLQLNGWDLTAPPVKLTGSFVVNLVLIAAMIVLGLIYENTSAGSQRKLDEERSQSGKWV
ncbi:MAG: hypothetical protein GY866_41990 [Proteobacteria bacterium]|nr:hypothetical protein [Pseudomonadota bacterium]